MTVRSETRQEISASREDIYLYLSDVSRWPEWAQGIMSCEVGGGGPLVSGCRLNQQAKKPFGAAGARTLDVTSVDAPQQLAFAGTMGPTSITWGFDLQDTDQGVSELLLWIEAKRGGAMRLLPAGVLRSMFRKVNQRELLAIKAAIEAPAKHSAV